MTIIEAIKSGRRFRRPDGLWFTKAARGNFFDMWDDEVEGGRSSVPGFDPDSILADDWETQEPSVTITLSDFRKAYAEAYRESFGAANFPDAIAKKLGLGEP